MKIKEILEKGISQVREIDEGKLKVKMILANLLNVQKEYFISHDDEELSSQIVENFFEQLEELKKGVPVQYIINSQEFMGFNFYVDKNVLIPQPDTEILVQEAVNICDKFNKKIKVLDLCTGSGAIGISIAKFVGNSEITGSDISPKALEIAEENARINKVKINFIESDLFDKISKTKFDIIVSNPPYIKTDVINKLSEEVKNEPTIALDGGADGLKFYRKIAEKSKEFLEENGYLILEIGYDQKDAVIEILKKFNYKNIYSKKDYGGNDRIVIAQIYSTII